MHTGDRYPHANRVKVFGTDLAQIEAVPRQVETVLKAVPGTSRRAREAEDHDRCRDHGRPVADPLEHRDRLGSDAAHRRADDRRHGVADRADVARDPGNLRAGQRLAAAAGAFTESGWAASDALHCCRRIEEHQNR